MADARSVTAEHVHRLPRGGPYRSIEGLSGALGCEKDLGGNTLQVNCGLAAALFVTSLCGPYFGAGPKAPPGLVKPSSRLAQLMHELGRKPGRFDMSDEESAALVDKASRRLWGRTAFDEIAADIDAMDAASQGMASRFGPSSEGLYGAYTDFIALRRRFLAAAQKAGPASLLPYAFPLVWRDRLLPWHVVATPKGSFGEEDGRVVFGANLNVPPGFDGMVPARVIWGRLHSEGTEAAMEFAPQADAAWLHMLERHGPRALIMLNGRRHRLMIPPELERVVSEVGERGVQVRFHPYFEWPKERDDKTCAAEAVELADFSGRSSFRCDITGTEVQPMDATVMTPWEFRRSALLPKFREATDPILAEVVLAADWSDWVVRRDLLN